MLWTSLNPQLKFVVFWGKFFLFVRMMSFNVGFPSFVKQVAPFIMFSIPQISQTVFNGLMVLYWKKKIQMSVVLVLRLYDW
jgi:hypothetical protein